MSYRYEVQRSPNHSSRSGYGYDATPSGITIHWWGRMGQRHDAVADYLCRRGGNTSAHEVISAGRVTHLVDFDRAAWHAGSTEGNGDTIGLECRPEMSAADLETVAQRCADIERQLGRSMRYYGHRDWKATACPGGWYDRIGWIVKRVNEIHAGTGGGGATPGGEDDDMTPEQADLLRWIHAGLYYGSTVGETRYPGVLPILAETQRRVTSLAGLVARQGGVSVDELAAAVVPQLSAALLPALDEVMGDVLGADNKAQAEAIVAEMARRLTTEADTAS